MSALSSPPRSRPAAAVRWLLLLAVAVALVLTGAPTLQAQAAGQASQVQQAGQTVQVGQGGQVQRRVLKKRHKKKTRKGKQARKGKRGHLARKGKRGKKLAKANTCKRAKGKRSKKAKRCKKPRFPVVPGLTLNYNYARSGSPLGGPWGHYDGPADPLNQAFHAAAPGSHDKLLLSKSAMQPRARWFGAWIAPERIGGLVREHIAVSQKGDPNKLVQMATFNLWPRGEWMVHSPLTPAEQHTYRRWVDEAAAAIGHSRVMIIVEPDLAVAVKAPDMDVRLGLASYAAQAFGRLPHTTVYLDGSAADWLPPQNAVEMLIKAGVAHTRGFALGATHYDDVASNVRYTQVVAAGLAGRGLPDKHGVIDTADTGRPFTWNAYYAANPGGRFDNAPACSSAQQQTCWALGDRPTTYTVDPANVDAYLWFGRPWLDFQANPFSLERARWLGALAPW